MKYDEKSLLSYLETHPEGCTTTELALHFRVKSRTIERWRSKLISQGKDLQMQRKERSCYWKLNAATPHSWQPNSEELCALYLAIAQLDKRGFASLPALQSFAKKAEQTFSPSELPRIQVDQEALLQAETYAWEPELKEALSHPVLGQLRRAILSLRKVRFDYPSYWDNGSYSLLLEPIGILHKFQSYLIGRTAKGDYRYYKIRSITSLQILEENSNLDPDFSLAKYLEDCFGVFHGSRKCIQLRFSPKIAENASSILFHPKQTELWNPDGSLEVRFYSGSDRELLHYLFSWGKQVEILGPKILREQYRDLLSEVIENYDEPVAKQEKA